MGSGLGSWIIVAAALVAAAPAAANNAELNTAVDLLRSSAEELRREEAAYRDAIDGKRISGQEREDYATFIADLRVRVYIQCEAVRALGGEAALRGHPCVLLVQLPRSVAPASAAKTDEEKREAMNARLNQLEGDIDESLMKRQQTIRQTASRSSGGGGGGGSGAAGGGAGGGASGAAASAGGAQSGGQPASGQNSGASGGDAGAGANAGQSAPAAAGGQTARRVERQTPTDGGVDDDVVARQLREAAEKETDPVLKEKLWAEYRKYREAKR